jgi:hypothetical protein
MQKQTNDFLFFFHLNLIMVSKRSMIDFRNQFKRFRIPLLIFLLFWIAGIVIIYVLEPIKNLGHIILVSMSIRPGQSTSDFIGVYQLLWPIMIEVFILGILLSILLDYYSFNPVVNARKKARGKNNHTVVLGYNHLGERIVEYLRENQNSYVVVEKIQERVDDLIHIGEPVIVGDYAERDTMRTAGVSKCKEVFCVTTNLRRALIAAESIRKLNTECDLYMRVFDEHFREYLSEEPYKAFTFSSSNWAMASIKNWSKDSDGKSIVLGNDSLVNRILTYYGEVLKREIIAIDQEIEPDLYSEFSNVKIIQEEALFLENLEENCNLDEVSQIYICWNKEELFSDAILLTLALQKNYPNIRTYVRMFDEELAKIAKSINATTFSTSAYAFQMLQKEVKENSGIYTRNK